MLVMAESGTGVDVVDEELDELEEPPLLDELLELLEEDASADVGVVVASWLPAADAAFVEFNEDAVEESVVELLFVVVDSVEDDVVGVRPVFDDGESVDTVPFDEADVRPDVLCAAELLLELPCM